MSSVNKAILVGNLGSDPEVRDMPSGKQVCNFNIATSEVWRDKNSGEKQTKTEWHRIVLFDKIAEVAGTYLKKEALFTLKDDFKQENGLIKME